MLWPWTIRSPPRVRRRRRAASGPALPAYSWRWTEADQHVEPCDRVVVGERRAHRVVDRLDRAAPLEVLGRVGVHQQVVAVAGRRRQRGQPGEQLVVDPGLVGGEPAVARPDRVEGPHHPAVHHLGVAERPHAQRDDLVVAEHGSTAPPASAASSTSRRTSAMTPSPSGPRSRRSPSTHSRASPPDQRDPSSTRPGCPQRSGQLGEVAVGVAGREGRARHASRTVPYDAGRAPGMVEG